MTDVFKQNQVKKFYADDLAQKYFEELRELIAIPSIFTQNRGLAEAAQKLVQIFEDAGAEVTLDKTYAAPFVMAKFISEKADARTLIFYNHYDVQPADADQPWTSDPFTLTVRGDHIYGRGVDDDKGHITARLTAVQKVLAQLSDLPVNVIFIIEGAEESASVDFDKYLDKYAPDLRGADLLVWEQGVFNDKEQMEITGGTKGIVTFDAHVKSAELDIHSKFGATIDTATWYLINALSSLRDKDGTILVDGIYDDVIPPTEREMDLVREHAGLTEEGLIETYGLSLPLLTQDREEMLETLFFKPALTIEGLTSGYQGQGVKTILPSTASAKLEVRLVPGMKPKEVLAKIQRQLFANGYDKIELTYTLGEEGYRSDMTAPAILKAIEIAERLTPAGVTVLPTSPGTGPMHQVFEALEVPIAAFGIGNPNSRDHADDENVHLADYYSHIEMIEELIKSYE